MPADSIKISHIRTSSTMETREKRACATAVHHSDSNGQSLPKPVDTLEHVLLASISQLKSYLCSSHKKCKALKA